MRGTGIEPVSKPWQRIAIEVRIFAGIFDKEG